VLERIEKYAAMTRLATPPPPKNPPGLLGYLPNALSLIICIKQGDGMQCSMVPRITSNQEL